MTVLGWGGVEWGRVGSMLLEQKQKRNLIRKSKKKKKKKQIDLVYVV